MSKMKYKMNDLVKVFLLQEPQKNNILLMLWFLLAIVCLFINYLTGPTIQFPILFVLPVILSSWFNGKYWGFFFAIALPLTQFYFNVRWEVGWDLANVAINTIIRILVMLMAAFLTDIASKKERLENQVQQLEGLLPICSSCKKIRDESNEWQPMEKYISERSNADFTHGVCPECMEKLYSQYILKKKI